MDKHIKDFKVLEDGTLEITISATIRIKKCQNCGEYFVPEARSDEKYCDRMSPQDASKTCKRYGAIKAHTYNVNNNEDKKLSRMLYSRKSIRAKREKPKGRFNKEFEDFKRELFAWRSVVANSEEKRKEFIEWLRWVNENDM